MEMPVALLFVCARKRFWCVMTSVDYVDHGLTTKVLEVLWVNDVSGHENALTIKSAEGAQSNWTLQLGNVWA